MQYPIGSPRLGGGFCSWRRNSLQNRPFFLFSAGKNSGIIRHHTEERTTQYEKTNGKRGPGPLPGPDAFLRHGPGGGRASLHRRAPGALGGDAVQYVYENNLMGGTDSTTFSPNATTTRGMIVTVLYRLTGEPASGTASQFTDVAAGLGTPRRWLGRRPGTLSTAPAPPLFPPIPPSPGSSWR